ncbi:unnamed protein product [marine sediment metagenome]|uniref:Uncharacterized protein n=1 Tax=marine sediment metagenome TaxID=412755 RepID=X0RET5_9ZZZZ
MDNTKKKELLVQRLGEHNICILLLTEINERLNLSLTERKLISINTKPIETSSSNQEGWDLPHTNA